MSIAKTRIFPIYGAGMTFANDMLGFVQKASLNPGINENPLLNYLHALVAQLDRAPGFEPGGRGFESLRACFFFCDYEKTINMLSGQISAMAQRPPTCTGYGSCKSGVCAYFMWFM